MYGMSVAPGMKRTTVYFSEEMKSRITHEAARRGITEAELIRQAVERELRVLELGAGIIKGDGGGLNAADLTRENKHIWLEGFGES